jgi:hypothetical protein
MTGVGGAKAHPLYAWLNIRGKNRKELLGGFLRNIMRSADEVLIMSGLKVTPGPLLDSSPLKG